MTIGAIDGVPKARRRKLRIYADQQRALRGAQDLKAYTERESHVIGEVQAAVLELVTDRGPAPMTVGALVAALLKGPSKQRPLPRRIATTAIRQLEADGKLSISPDSVVTLVKEL